MANFESDSIGRFQVDLSEMGFNENQMKWVQDLLQLCEDLREERNHAMRQAGMAQNEVLGLEVEIGNLNLQYGIAQTELKDRQNTINYQFHYYCNKSKEILELEKKIEEQKVEHDAVELKLHREVFAKKEQIEQLKKMLKKN